MDDTPAPVHAPDHATTNAAAPHGAGRLWLGIAIGCGASLALACVGGAIVAAVVALWHAAPGPQAGTDDPAPPRVADVMRAPSHLSIEAVAIQDALDEEALPRARELADAYLAAHPELAEAKAMHATVAITQAVAAEASGDADRALQAALEAGLAIDLGLQVDVAELWLNDGEADRAERIADRVIRALPAPADEVDAATLGAAYLIRGLAKGEQGDPSGAERDVRKAISLAPDAQTRKEWQDYLDELRKSQD